MKNAVGSILRPLFFFLFCLAPLAVASELPLQLQYLRALEPWVKAAMTEIDRPSDDTAVYGLGQNGHWYMQAHDTAFTAFAVLATDPNTDVSRTGMSKEDMRKIALDMLRYTLRSHKVGGGTCTNGQSWGHSWISSLGLERMTFGIEALDAFLDDELRDLYRNVTASEADWLLKEPLKAGLTDHNRPESNMWNGIMLHRAALLQPDHPRAAEWKDRGSDYLVNAISVPSDADNEKQIGGKPIKDRFVGANMYESMACNHHRYMNIGYMYIPLSNLAIFHFSCKKAGVDPPEALYHNVERLWEIVKACTFPDGRLARIGGDTRIRYCYCQDYAIPTWLLALDLFGDFDVERFEKGWIGIVGREQKENPSGWFMESRLKPLAEKSPLYFQRIEGDKACTFAFGAYYRRVFNFDTTPKRSVEVPDGWYDEYHGAWFCRGEKRFASWCWRSALGVTGLCVPADGSDLAEWQFNLGGRISGMGLQDLIELRAHSGGRFEGGFATAGRVRFFTANPVAEGQGREQTAVCDLACCALPDDRTMVVVQRAVTEFPTYLKQIRALSLSVPNDLFNGYKRTIYRAGGTETLTAMPDRFEWIDNTDRWLNVDDRLGVVEIYGGTPKVARPAQRQIAIRGVAPAAAGGLLYAEEICQDGIEGVRRFGANESLFDCAAVILVGDAKSTAALAASKNVRKHPHPSEDVRVVQVSDALNREYVIAVNFSKSEIPFEEKRYSDRPLRPIRPADGALEPFGIAVWEILP